MFKTNDHLKLDLSDKSKYVPGIEFPLAEKYLLDKDSRRLRWMRHMWAFFDAQVIKEIYLYMHLKINRTSRLVSSYYKGMETIIDEFGSGYQKLFPVLDLPHAVKIKNRFAEGEDTEREAAREARRHTFFGDPFETTPIGMLNLPIM